MTLLQTYLKSHHLNFLQSGCTVYDKNLKVVLSVPGDMCIFEPDGSTIVATAAKLQKYDSRFKLLWSLDFKANHQLKLSQDGESLLVIESQYYPQASNLPLRYDNLHVLSKDGNFLKSYKFKTNETVKAVLKEFGPVDNNWTADGYAGKSVEATHLNSFSEIYKTVGTKKILTGYVVANATPSLIMFFDPHLKPTKVISLAGSKIHDIQQVDENLFLFYGNYLNESDSRSFVGTIDLEQGLPKILHRNSTESLGGRSCGSVQKLEGERYFVLHSNCEILTGGGGERPQAHWEFVDKHSQQQEVLWLPRKLVIGHLKIIDLKSYFQKNIGF